MKRLTHILLIAAVTLLVTSCVSQHSVNRTYAPLTPDVVRLNVTMEDYVYLGEQTVEVTYKTYLGIFRKVLTINGEDYNPRYYRSTYLALNRSVRVNSIMRKALYKVADTYPGADYIMPVTHDIEVKHMLGGRITKETMTIKVFALNKTSEVAKQQQALEQKDNAIQAQEAENAQLKARIQALQEELNAAQRSATQRNNTNRRR